MTFGLAVIKQEGERLEGLEGINPEKTPLEDKTFWLEVPFTKAEFAALADLLESSSELFIRKLGKDCRYRSVKGYGRS